MSKVTASRKADHIRVNLEEDVASGVSTGLERLRFDHNALPELDFKQVDTSLELFGRTLAAPLLISSMTGGTDQAAELNRRLATAAQATGVAMGIGSQRAALENPALAASFEVRPHAPDILLFANLGAVQLNYGYGLEQAQRAVEMVQADALVLHLNPLQEALQPEGDTDFSELLPKIGELCEGLPVPVVVKEVGWGISGEVAARLVGVGVAGIDVAGAGGTSWSQVEMHRAQSEAQARLAAEFVGWGIPTADALAEVRDSFPDLTVIASGGLRDGLDLAKCLALGADLCGMAGPFLRAAADSTRAVEAAIQHYVSVTRVCMFATGSATLLDFRQASLRT